MRHILLHIPRTAHLERLLWWTPRRLWLWLRFLLWLLLWLWLRRGYGSRQLLGRGGLLLGDGSWCVGRLKKDAVTNTCTVGTDTENTFS